MKTLITISIFLIFSQIYAAEYSPVPDSVYIGKHPEAAVPFDLTTLKSLWEKRILAIKKDGQLPVIDIESSFDSGKINAKNYAKSMDNNQIALTAFSPQVGMEKYKDNGTLWHDGARRAVGADPSRYIPTSTSGIYPVFTKDPSAFVQETISRVEKENYPIMGEFEFRHYMSPRQYKRGETYRDVAVSLDSDAGHKLFRFSDRSGISFQIHYEIEDTLLAPLEKMLTKYPNAKVIWCHLAQVRYSSRAKNYGPNYVRHLIENYPNIYFDLAFGDAGSVYPGSREHHARVWNNPGHGVKQAWIDLITDHPYRFLAALDIGGDRMDHVSKNTKTLRAFIGNLPKETQDVVAYKAAWKLIFNEDISVR
ncbi:MAG: amidohydrolase [Proteobacteria bacterium]|nr:amidohydrolase [Pseudomonadota bacterium]MBU1582319.1 amidohydrolase [Pseudomonadota bacterium]MBU2452243.1 amidohydrolase [Pseudomonadota bacterium]MBU2627979.1 amidohydrolase [Pseudomonadota bacterium]